MPYLCGAQPMEMPGNRRTTRRLSPRHPAAMTAGVLLICLIINVLLASCRHAPPQLPSNKRTADAEERLDFTQVNHRIALSEDSLIARHVAANRPEMERADEGYWFKKELHTGRPRAAPGDTCRLICTLSALSGEILQRFPPQTIVVGRKNVIDGLDIAVEKMCEGEEFSFIFPSHLAYGLRGYGQLVAPFTPVMFHVKMEELRKKMPETGG